MSNRLQRIEIGCDAPAYPVVQACRYLGIQAPEDVRWLRMSEFRASEDRSHHRSLFQFWKMWRGRGKPPVMTCSCGEPLPALRLAVFPCGMATDVSSYFLGQCNRCRTVFWDEA